MMWWSAATARATYLLRDARRVLVSVRSTGGRPRHWPDERRPALSAADARWTPPVPPLGPARWTVLVPSHESVCPISRGPRRKKRPAALPRPRLCCCPSFARWGSTARSRRQRKAAEPSSWRKSAPGSSALRRPAASPPSASWPSLSSNPLTLTLDAQRPHPKPEATLTHPSARDIRSRTRDAARPVQR